MILIINTCLAEQLEIITAEKADKFKVKKIAGKFQQSEKLLPAISAAVKSFGGLKKLKGIGVVTGPGGFTSVRIGVAVANALAYGLNLPIIGLKVSEFKDNQELVEKIFNKIKTAKLANIVMPYYDREPNITVKKET